MMGPKFGRRRKMAMPAGFLSGLGEQSSDKKKLTKRESRIMNEAFITGRVYSARGEIEKLSEIQEKLESNCLRVKYMKI